MDLSLSDSDAASPLTAAVDFMSPLAVGAAESPSPLATAATGFAEVEPRRRVAAAPAVEVSRALTFRETADSMPFAWLRKVPRESRQKIRACRSPRSARAAITAAMIGNTAAPAGLLEDLRQHTQVAQRQVMDLEEELERQRAAQEAQLQALRSEHKRKCKRAKLRLLAEFAPEGCSYEAESFRPPSGRQVAVQDLRRRGYDDTRSDVGSLYIAAAPYDEPRRQPQQLTSQQLTSPSSKSSVSPTGMSGSSRGDLARPRYSSVPKLNMEPLRAEEY